MRVVYLRTDSIGDTVLATAVLQPLKRAREGVDLTVCAPEPCAPIYEASPYVDRVIPFDRMRAVRDEFYRATIVLRLQSLHPDIMIHGAYSRETLGDYLAGMAGAVELVGMSGDLSNMTADARSMNDRHYTHLIESVPGVKLELERHRELMEGIGIDVERDLHPTLWTTSDDVAFADAFFSEHQLESGKVIALFAGTQSPMRRYAHFGMALRSICAETGFPLLALGSPDATDITRENLAAVPGPTIDATGRTTLRQAAEILRRCRLAVGAETGLAHVAAAVGTPNVILVGGGHWGRFLPWSETTTVVSLPLDCYGCNWQCRWPCVHCVSDVDPHVLEQAIRDRLSGRAGKRVFLQDWRDRPGPDIQMPAIAPTIEVIRVSRPA